MARRSRTDPKSEALRARGSLNPDPKRVTDEAFRHGGYFDARDLVQVKYEMVRRAEIDGWPASHAAQTFGVSRPTFYAAKAALDSGGIPALVPAKPGPRRAHKLSDAVVDALEQALVDDPGSASASTPTRARSSGRLPGAEKKNADDERASAAELQALAERYEELRAQVLARRPAGKGLGLTLFVREGMAAWAHAWDRIAEPASRPQRTEGAGLGVSPRAGIELVHMLAGMALGTLNEEVS